MALGGILQSFPATELLQFHAYTKKTGILRVFDEEDSKFIAFREGELEYIVHQRRLPDLAKLLERRGLLGSGPEDIGRRGRRPALTTPPFQKVTLASLLLARGRLREDKLKMALEPERVPEELLETVIKTRGLVPPAQLHDTLSGRQEGETLLDCVLNQCLVERDQLVRALADSTDEFLAELLVANDLLSRAEARQCLHQLYSLRGDGSSSVRLGEYLVTTGQISQQQFERAINEQLGANKRLGEILIERGRITSDGLLEAIEDIERLSGEFSALFPLREKLVLREWISEEEFDAALEECRDSDRPLAAILVAGEKLSGARAREAIRAVLTEELSDVLLWPHASFEFIDGHSLEDALPPTELVRVHTETFDIQQLLLEAHSNLDELGRAERETLSLLNVFVTTGATAEEISDAEAVQYHRALRSFDGSASLRDVHRLLPGTLFSHRMLFSELLRRELIRPLTRKEAYLRGRRALADGLHAEARTLFRHALRFPGDDPTTARLQTAMQEVLEVRERVQQKQQRGISNAVNPWRIAAALLLFAVLVAGGVFLRPRAAEDLAFDPPADATANAASTPRELPSTRTPDPVTHRLAARVDVAPNLDDEQRVYVAARDGTLQAFRYEFASDPDATASEEHSLIPLWSVPVGEWGDLLAPPVRFADRLYSVNRRGTAFAVDLDGQLIWSVEVARPELLPPALLLSEAGQLAGVAVVARDAVQVLLPGTGESVHRFAVTSRVHAPPVGNSEAFVVGGGDDFIYRVDWRGAGVRWKHAARDDVIALERARRQVVFATRNGTLGAISFETGELLWSQRLRRAASRLAVRLGDIEVEDVVLVATRSELEAFSLGDGTRREEFNPDQAQLRIREARLHAGVIACLASDGRVRGINERGEVLWSSVAPWPGRVTDWSASGDAVAVATRDGLLQVLPTGTEK